MTDPRANPVCECPVCQKRFPKTTPLAAHYPFCSPRCKQVDLYRWRGGKYAIVDPLTPDKVAELQDEGLLPPDEE